MRSAVLLFVFGLAITSDKVATFSDLIKGEWGKIEDS
jgi:hypothetical protein